MEATRVARATTRVAMVAPPRAVVGQAVVDLRAEPRLAAELVDQAHHGELLTVLADRGEWRYVQGEDLYFGWTHAAGLLELGASRDSFVVAVPLAQVRDGAQVIGEIPVGTRLDSVVGEAGRPVRARIGGRGGTVTADQLVRFSDIPHRPPAATDLLATAEAFLGVPYLWGGTTARGIDCSGLVQQVYRLNGVGLPRDADQQAMFGRPVDTAEAGDLLFFGEDSVTHVALATGGNEFLHAPQTGAFVEKGRLGPERRLRSIRRYLLDHVLDT